MACERALRPKTCKLANNRSLIRIISKKLELFLSPQQLAGLLKLKYPKDENSRVSHETIYRSLLIQTSGVLKNESLQYQKIRRKIRRGKYSSSKNSGAGKIKDAISISERPSSVEDRAIPGHWEGDLIEGTKNTFIATLVERQTRYVMLAKVTDKQTNTVVNALIKQAKKSPTELYKSLT